MVEVSRLNVDLSGFFMTHAFYSKIEVYLHDSNQFTNSAFIYLNHGAITPRLHILYFMGTKHSPPYGDRNT